MKSKNPLPLKLLLAASLILSTVVDLNAAAMTDIGKLPGDTNSYASVISGDGNLIVGSSSRGTTERIFYIYKNGVITDMGSLGGSNIEVHGISYDGSVVVGIGSTGPNYTGVKGFKYDHGVITVIDDYTLDGVSNDGLVFAGTKQVGLYSHAIKVQNNIVTDLGTLAGNTSYSSSSGISGDGKVIIGSSSITGNYPRAFKYENGSMLSLGTLGGNWSEANGVSYNGSIIVGHSDTSGGTTAAFKYQNGVMTNLGTLGGVFASANAISQDGKVIVGESSIAGGIQYQMHAFKYVNGVMSDLGTLGGTQSAATGVSANGLYIVGWSYIAGDTEMHGFIYNNSGMVDVPSWMNSVAGANTAGAISLGLVGGFLEGAHHRPLTDFDNMGKSSSVWVTGDFSTSGGSLTNNGKSGEIGLSNRLGQQWIAGLAVGFGRQNQDLANSGSCDVSGNYLLGEIDYRYKKGVISALLAYGDWGVDINRGYNVGGSVDYSKGTTSNKTLTLRLRADTRSFRITNSATLTPYASVNFTKSDTAAFTENGGSFPAYFNSNSQNSTEARLGAAVKMPINTESVFRVSAEVIQRLDSATSTISGVDTSGTIPFSISATSQKKTRTRLGFDFDQRISDSTLLNLSLHFTSGVSATTSGAISIRQSF